MLEEKIFKKDIRKSLLISAFLLGLFILLFYLDYTFNLLNLIPKL